MRLTFLVQGLQGGTIFSRWPKYAALRLEVFSEKVSLSLAGGSGRTPTPTVSPLLRSFLKLISPLSVMMAWFHVMTLVSFFFFFYGVRTLSSF